MFYLPCLWSAFLDTGDSLLGAGQNKCGTAAAKQAVQMHVHWQARVQMPFERFAKGPMS